MIKTGWKCRWQLFIWLVLTTDSQSVKFIIMTPIHSIYFVCIGTTFERNSFLVHFVFELIKIQWTQKSLEINNLFRYVCQCEFIMCPRVCSKQQQRHHHVEIIRWNDCDENKAAVHVLAQVLLQTTTNIQTNFFCRYCSTTLRKVHDWSLTNSHRFPKLSWMLQYVWKKMD